MSQVSQNWSYPVKYAAIGAMAALALGAGLPQAAAAGDFDFGTTGEYVRQCDSPSPPNQCLGAIQEVELVVDTGDNHNATCDGGYDELANSASNDQLMAKLAARVSRVVPWLKAHPEYADKPYDDGVWAALKGAYCP
jgi:hypothetical protein